MIRHPYFDTENQKRKSASGGEIIEEREDKDSSGERGEKDQKVSEALYQVGKSSSGFIERKNGRGTLGETMVDHIGGR